MNSIMIPFKQVLYKVGIVIRRGLRTVTIAKVLPFENYPLADGKPLRVSNSY